MVVQKIAHAESCFISQQAQRALCPFLITDVIFQKKLVNNYHRTQLILRTKWGWKERDLINDWNMMLNWNLSLAFNYDYIGNDAVEREKDKDEMRGQYRCMR